MIVKPEVSGSETLEGLVREMLRPMLRDWLDANLPAMVETMVAREIERITSK
jgi:cell pole-organizing protein PopZ